MEREQDKFQIWTVDKIAIELHIFLRVMWYVYLSRHLKFVLTILKLQYIWLCSWVSIDSYTILVKAQI